MAAQLEYRSRFAVLDSIYPWFIWLLGSAFIFYNYLVQVSPSVMSNELMLTFHTSGSSFGNLAAYYFYAYLIMQIPTGVLLDKFSPRVLTSSAIFVCAIGALIFANAHELWQASLGRALIGMGAAFSAISFLKLISVWFKPKHFALLAGLMMTAAMLGAVFGQSPLTMLVDNYGWRSAMQLIAYIGLALSLCYWLIVRDKPRQPILLAQSTTGFTMAGFWGILKHPQTWLLSLYSGLAFAPVSVFAGLWGDGFLQQAYHFSRAEAAMEVSFIFVGFAIGAPILGWLSDYMGRRKPLMYLGTAIALISMLIILYMPNLSLNMLRINMFVFGLGISGFLICFTMVREIHILALTATAVAFMNTFDAFLGAITDPLVGRFLDISSQYKLLNGLPNFSAHDYHLALLTLPLYLVISLILLVFIKETYCKS